MTIEQELPGSRAMSRGAFQLPMSPLDIGPFVLKNRMICTGHIPLLQGPDGLTSDAEIAFHLSVHSIGDCVAPRDVEYAVFEAHRVAREV